MGKNRGICAGALAAMIAVAGCVNPFQTGNPDDPRPPVDYPPPTSAENVLAIVDTALGAEDPLSYMDRFAADFTFVPDPVQHGSAEFQNFPTPWGVEAEREFTNRLLTNAESLSLDWEIDQIEPVGAGSRVTADYALVVRASGATTRYAGRAIIVMRQDAGEWVIETWSDFVAGTEDRNTWGLLRARVLATG